MTWAGAAVGPVVPGTVFNQERFHALNVGPGQRAWTVCVRDERAGRVIGSVGGVVDGEVFVSGYSAPYGGVDLCRVRETPGGVARLVDGVLEQLQAAGVRTVRMRMPPAALGPSEGLIAYTLLNRGFRVARCELNQHLDLSRFADAEGYVVALKSPARRALAHSLRSGGLAFAEAAADDLAAWDRAHALLVANRAAKGRALALSRDYVERVRHALGARTVRMFFLQRPAGSVVAAALVYRVRPSCDLVVAWGDAPDHGLGRSPMNLLAYRVVEQALGDGVTVLDLGVSSEPDAAASPNGGLHQFKQSVLARSEPRLTLVKDL